jgi:hypothetical protein
LKPKCTGTSKRTGGPCGNYPIHGHTVCVAHGGRAPQVKAKAARNLVEGQALKAVSAMGNWAPVTDPLSALADVAGEVTAVKDFLRGLVDRIVERESGNMSTDGLRVPDDKGAEQMRAEFQAYMAMLNSTVATLATIAKLNIDERMARIEEARKTMIIEAMRRGFAAAGVTGEAHTRGLAATVKHLRVVGS